MARSIETATGVFWPYFEVMELFYKKNPKRLISRLLEVK